MQEKGTMGKGSDIPAGVIPVTRRAVMGFAGAGGLALLLSRSCGAMAPFFANQPAAGQAASGAPVGTVFADLPYVDMTGRAEPYVPPTRISSNMAQAHRALGHPWANCLDG